MVRTFFQEVALFINLFDKALNVNGFPDLLGRNFASLLSNNNSLAVYGSTGIQDLKHKGKSNCDCLKKTYNSYRRR